MSVEADHGGTAEGISLIAAGDREHETYIGRPSDYRGPLGTKQPSSVAVTCLREITNDASWVSLGILWQMQEEEDERQLDRDESGVPTVQ